MTPMTQVELDGKPRPAVEEELRERDPQRILRSGRCFIVTTDAALKRATAKKKKQSKDEKLKDLKKWVQHHAKVSGTVEPGEWDRGTEALHQRLIERVH